MANSKAIGVAYEDPSFTSLNVTGATTLDGAVAIGNAAGDLVGFHGATAVDQAAFVATLSINALSVSGVIGFTTSASFSTAITAINSILAALIEKGLMAAS
jgi:hypothetical protein